MEPTSIARRLAGALRRRAERAMTILAAPALIPAIAHGQGATFPAAPQRPATTVERYDEDWSPLADPAMHTGPLDAVKWMTLAPDVALTIGGEARLRGEDYSQVDLGFAPADDYGLLRLETHADLHVGRSARAFLQLRYTPVIGAQNPLASVQRGGVDVAQSFVDMSQDVGAGRATLRVGRQMIVVRSLLVQPREGANIKVSFDGIRGYWIAPSGPRLDAFATRVVQPRFGSFDDRSTSRYALWGANLSTVDDPAAAAKPGVDLYYIGVRRPGAAFGRIVADETRHSLGLRWVGQGGPWQWSIEGTYQFGRFGAERISAFTVINRASLGFHLPGHPRLAIAADATSGDRRPGDGRRGTFEVPFPQQPYLVQANVVAPANTIDLHPSVIVEPARGWTASAGYLAMWKFSRSDAFYLPGPRPVAGSEGSPRFQQNIVQFDVHWQANQYLSIEAGFDRALPSATLRRLGARRTDFGLLMTTFRF